MANLNDFGKEERIAWEKLGEKFEDYLVLSENVDIFNTDQETMQRSGDTMRRPMPYHVQTNTNGLDQTDNFQSITGLTVPATIDQIVTAAWTMNSKELRDDLQNNRFGESAIEKIASDINTDLLNLAALQGTLVVTKTSAASEFKDVADLESIFNRTGVRKADRKLAYSTPDYNGLARDLANRANLNQGKTLTAYEEAYVGKVASFETFKLDSSVQLLAAGGGGSITIDTRAVGVNNWVPAATSTATTGQRSNVDNRYQQVTVSSTTSVVAGDVFTIAGLFEVHHITKQSTGVLKTFRVISNDSATLLTISPPIIGAQGGSNAEKQYQNCSIVTPASNAAIVFKNTVAAPANPFWVKGAIELLPGRLAVPSDAGASVMRMTTKNKIEVVFQKQYDIRTSLTFFRMDVLYGRVMKQPEMAGIQLFSQS